MLGNKEIMSKNIKNYMEKKGIDRNQLCYDLNLKYMTVSDWINGKTYPRIDKIELLANYFNINKSDLVEDKEEQSSLTLITEISSKLDEERQKNVLTYANQQYKEQNKVTFINDHKKKKEEVPSYIDIDVVGLFTAGLGTENFNKSKPVEVVTLNERDVPDKFDLAIKVVGHSMEPYFRDSEILFVRRTHGYDSIQNGMFAVVEINKEAYIKKIYIEDNKLKLVSLNKETDIKGNYLYPDFYADENDDIHVIGKIIMS